MSNFEDDSLHAKIKFDQCVNKDPDQDIINVNIRLDSLVESDKGTDDRKGAQNLIVDQQDDVITSEEHNDDVNTCDVNSYLVRSSLSSNRFTVSRPSQKANPSVHETSERKIESSQKNNSLQQEQTCSSEISLSRRLMNCEAPTTAILGARVASKTPIGKKDSMFKKLMEQEQPCCSGINSKPRVNETKASERAKAFRRSSKSPNSFAKETDQLQLEKPCSSGINLVKRMKKPKAFDEASFDCRIFKNSNFSTTETSWVQKQKSCSSETNLIKRSMKTGSSSATEADVQRKSNKANVFPKLKDNLRKENSCFDRINSRKRKLTPGKYGSGFPFGKRVRHPGVMSPYEVDSSSDEETLLGNYHLVGGVPFVKRTNLKKDVEEKSTVRGKRKLESFSGRIVAKKLKL